MIINYTVIQKDPTDVDNFVKYYSIFGRPLGPGLCHRKSVRPSVCNVGGLWPNGLSDRDDFWHTPCPGQQ